MEEQLATLRSQLQSQSGILSISIEQIEPNPEQPRQTFLPESIESMSRSLAEDGQLQPIILIQRENLVLFDGERRWRSASSNTFFIIFHKFGSCVPMSGKVLWTETVPTNFPLFHLKSIGHWQG